MQKDKETRQYQIPLPRALFFIFLSTCLITGSCFIALQGYFYVREKKKSDPAYTIVAVLQTTPDVEGLKTAYLSEILGLAYDHAQNLFRFDAQKGTEKLLKVHLVKEAKIRKIRPGTLHVDYVLRKPIAYLADYSNTAIDAEGYLFPYKPFFTPKRLPEIYLGTTLTLNEQTLWGTRVKGEGIDLAFALLKQMPVYCDNKSTLCRIDVSQAFAAEDGLKQIVLELEERLTKISQGKSVLCICPQILRLRPENYLQQLGNYLNLRDYLRLQDPTFSSSANHGLLMQKTTMIDLRVSDLAFFLEEI